MQTMANKTGQFFTSMWQAISGIGRKETMGEQVKAAQAQVEALQKAVDSGHGGPQAQARLDAAKQQLMTFQAALHDEQRMSAHDADQQADKDAKVAAQVRWNHIRDISRTQAQKEQEEIADIRRTGAALGKSQAEVDAQVAAYRAAHPIHAHVDNSDNNNAIEAIRGQIEQRRQLYELDVTNLQTSLAKGQITQEQFDQQQMQLHIRELQDDMDYAQKAANIAKSKGDKFKAEYTRWMNDYAKYKADIALAKAQEEKAEAAHGERIKAIVASSMNQASAFNSQRAAALDKANRQQYMTPQEKADADAREAIEVKYTALIAAETLRLQEAKASTDDVAKALAGLNQKRQEALDKEAEAVKQRLKTQGDWQVGASLAFRKYQEDAANVSGQTEQMFTTAFGKMEDALVNFATTGKLNFSQLATSIITDLIRMEVKAEETKILGYIGNFLGFSSSPSLPVKANANGGVYPVSMFASGEVVNGPRFFAGGAGLMGEQNPEAIMPLKRGADGRLGVSVQGGQPTQNVMTFDMSVNVSGNAGEDTVKQLQQQQAKQMQLIKGMIISEINNQQRPRGALSNVR